MTKEEAQEEPKGVPAESAFWDFTMAIYGRPGLSPALIGLQDRQGLDVNFLLFCLFAGARGQALAAAEFEALEAAVADWRGHVIHPLRAVRRWLREQSLVPVAASDPIRKAVLGQEIACEEQQQRLMEGALPLAEGEAAASTAAGNLLALGTWRGLSLTAEDLQALALILAGAFEGLTEPQAEDLLS